MAVLATGHLTSNGIVQDVGRRFFVSRLAQLERLTGTMAPRAGMVIQRPGPYAITG